MSLDWTHFTPWTSFAGGILIGAAAAMLVLLYGRIAGISGIVGGSALFGIGWGLAGFCPGPALVSFGSGQEKAAIFVAAMLGGMFIYTAADRLIHEPRRRARHHALNAGCPRD